MATRAESRLFLAALLFLVVIVASKTATADPRDIHDSTWEDRDPVGASGFFIRGGVGSLFGPAFDEGQPEYAHDDLLDYENRRPFSSAAQIASTPGLAGTYQLAVSPEWAFGITAMVGFNATSAWDTEQGFDLEVDDSLQGLTFGGGARATYGGGPMRLTFDALVSESRLKGEVDWNYEGFAGTDNASGHGEYEYGLTRFALLVGFEADVEPLFFFLNGGVQFLPRQERDYKIVGEFPYGDNSTFSSRVEARRSNRGRGLMTFDNELSVAVTTGIGVRL